jgi:putative sterol carrier protein
MVATSTTQESWRSVCGSAPGLAGLSCRVALYVASTPAGVMLIQEGGEVSIVEEKGEAAALIALDTQETLVGLLRGDLPPMVAHLQGRLRFEGDADLALRVLFGLQEASPWSQPFAAGKPS